MPTLPELITRLPAIVRSNCMWVCPQTITSASTSSSTGATRSSGVRSVKTSTSFRGVAWQKRIRSICTVGGNPWRNSSSSCVNAARVASSEPGGASPSSPGISSRSALPRNQRTRSPSARSRARVSAGCSLPETTSPPTTIVAASGTSASTASSAGRLPWMSYSVAIDLLDADGVRLVDEPSRKLGDQLAHRLFDALGLEQPGDGLGRQRALLEPAAHLRLVELDQRRLVLRVVAADDLDELAVTRRARVGGDDTVDGVLLRPDPRQSQLDCH